MREQRFTAWLPISKSKKKHVGVSSLLRQPVLDHTFALECLSGNWVEYLWLKYHQIIPLLLNGWKQSFGYNDVLKRNIYYTFYKCGSRKQGLWVKS